ncbi:hypothetical protein Hte_011255 [Hypoxylon texense]
MAKCSCACGCEAQAPSGKAHCDSCRAGNCLNRVGNIDNGSMANEPNILSGTSTQTAQALMRGQTHEDEDNFILIPEEFEDKTAGIV